MLQLESELMFSHVSHIFLLLLILLLFLTHDLVEQSFISSIEILISQAKIFEKFEHFHHSEVEVNNNCVQPTNIRYEIHTPTYSNFKKQITKIEIITQNEAREDRHEERTLMFHITLSHYTIFCPVAYIMIHRLIFFDLFSLH